MDSSSRWCPLPNFPGVPNLLVSARFGESSYTLHVTDLANIWVESLDRRGILLRSLQENTSIDLVDADREQWEVFLSKIRAALVPASSEHHLTRLSISANSNSNGDHDLTLRITCELPKPLAPFKWPVRLTKCQPAALASELVLPLVQDHYVRHREVEDLMGQLREKDALITKLLDKLNTMQTPLENIFNSLSAKHAITRAAAEERVKGLAPFSEGKWRSQRGLERPQNTPDLLSSVFGDSGFSHATEMDMGVSGTLNDWWTKLGAGSHAAEKAESSSSNRESKEEARSSEDVPGGADNDDFQVQATPTRLSSTPLAGGKSTAGDSTAEETESGSESDAPPSHATRSQDKSRSKIGAIGKTKAPTKGYTTSQSSQTLRADKDETASESEQPASSKHTKKPITRLGAIGQRGKSPQPTQAAPTATPSGEVNDETASGSDSDNDDPPKLRSSSREGPTTPRKAALGRIGGKPKKTTSPQSPGDSKSAAEVEVEAGHSTSPKKTGARKIGTIGRKPPAESKAAPEDNPAEPDEPETEERRAERKRAELARDLNRQGAVPARKKRKF
ncbi:XLF-domain-containing protein [Nemania sp. NC0429]|nr:XLF-domain-containing protein [Nemania sp. NC0429]KAI1109912.1 XLF-domain-containing protein [Nemania sp. NC0429]